MLAKLTAWWAALSPAEVLWLSVGLIGQAMFSARWLVQWLVTEKSRRSTMPNVFWYLSLLGGLLVLAYGVHRMDPVIILGQFGVLIYARNLFFIHSEKRSAAPDPPASMSTGRRPSPYIDMRNEPRCLRIAGRREGRRAFGLDTGSDHHRLQCGCILPASDDLKDCGRRQS